MVFCPGVQADGILTAKSYGSRLLGKIIEKKPKLDAVKLLSLLLIGFLFFSPAPRTLSGQSVSGTLVAQASQSREVWVNTRSGIYHYRGSHWYGNTKSGKYMSEAQAKASGYRASRNGQ